MKSILDATRLIRLSVRHIGSAMTRTRTRTWAVIAGTQRSYIGAKIVPREKRLDDLIIGTSPPPVAVVGDLTITTNAPGDYSSRITLTDKGIRKLAASGAICKVFGHWYPNVWIGERKCKLCGKVETKTEVWK